MSRFSKYVREKVVKVLVTALVVGSVAGKRMKMLLYLQIKAAERCVWN